MARQIPRSEHTSRRVGSTRRCQRRHVGIATRVTTRFPRVSMAIMPDMTGYDRDTSRSEGGRRGAEWCLRCHDDGVSRVDEGSKTHRFDFESRDDWQCRIMPLSVVSRPFQNKRLVFSRKFKNLSLTSVRGIFCIPRQ